MGFAHKADRKAVASAWQRVLGLDPAERVALAARQAAFEARHAEWLAQGAPKPKQLATPAPRQAPQQAPRGHQVQYDQDEDPPRASARHESLRFT